MSEDNKKEVQPKASPTEPGKNAEGDASATGPKGFHWVEAKYKRDDFTTFTARFYVLKAESCPQTAKDKAGNSGTLIEGTCTEVNQGCFIATAAFGSELDPHVQVLRRFRDEVLLQSELKESFSRVLDTYYRFSPSIAMAMKNNSGMRLLLKWVIVYPILIFVEAFVRLLTITHRHWSGFS